MGPGCVPFLLYEGNVLRLTLFTYVGKHNFDLINCLVQEDDSVLAYFSAKNM